MQEAVVAVCMKGIKDVLAGRSPHAGIDIEVLQGPAGPVLVEHARDASLLVLGPPDALGTGKGTIPSDWDQAAIGGSRVSSVDPG